MGTSHGDFTKYPRTPHLFGSKGTEDDRHLGEAESREFIAARAKRSPRSSPRARRKTVVTSRNQCVIFDIAIFTLGPSRPSQDRGKSKETRSVSEGFFDFSNKPLTRCDTNTSV